MSPEKNYNSRKIEWTGERCVPWADNIQVIYEHYQRYLFLAPLSKDRQILDLGSGEGYGANILSVEGTAVLGIDIDEASIRHATEKYQAENIAFQQGNILDLSTCNDDSFDLVVCFETLEHVEDHEKLIAEIKRVLRPEGILAISTPDRMIYSEKSGQSNPFHVHELSKDEFAGLLDANFRHVQTWAQNVSVGSLMTPSNFAEGEGSVIFLQRDGDEWVNGASLDASYCIGIASDSSLPKMPAYSTLTDPDLEILRRAARNQDEIVSELYRITRSLDEATEAQEVLRAIELDSIDNLRKSESRISHLRKREDGLRSRIEEARAECELNFTELERVRHELQFSEERLSSTWEELDRLLRSRQYRLGRVLYASIERLFPIGSIQRRVVARGMRCLRRLRGRSISTKSSALSDCELDENSLEPQRNFGMLPSVASSKNPRVSIIIPVYGEWEMTRRCLMSISGDIPATAYEVIVVDDASPDNTLLALQQISGIRVLHLEQNRGFLHAVNSGAEMASGEYLVLLNNDVEVRPGWLDALVDVVDLESDVGLVGARLVYPNGFLQEAGGIIFNDASGWNYGRHMDAGDPAFTFRRDVDYCSGACVLVKRALWEELGGFDPQFAPAYYEDADLAFSIRHAGYRVIYEPKSVVTHNEGGSYGTDESPKKSQLMKTNSEIFRQKWASELQHQFEPKEINVRLASWRRHAGHVLVMDHEIPKYDHDAGALRMFELLRILSELEYAITFIPHNKWNEPKYAAALEELGIEVLHGHIDIPYVIQQLSQDLRFVILSRPKVAWGILPTLQELAPATKVIYDTVDLHFLREQRRAEMDGDIEAARMAGHYRQLELWLTNASDMTFVVSDVEQEILQKEAPTASVRVLPTIHRLQQPGRPFEDREGLLFVGSFNHPPNRDAVEWLTEEVLPIVRRSLPEVPMFIVGSNPTNKVMELASHGTEVLGWVPELGPLYDKTRLVVAPLRYGAGIKGKIGEAASYGVPVVTTHIGAEGLHFEDGKDILVADTATDFAKAIVRAYCDPNLWSKLAQNARQSISLQCSPTVIKNSFTQILADLGL